MADADKAQVAALPGLPVLDALRPPEGFVTDVALATTYSLELPVALATMVALSGTAHETSDYGLHSAVRSLQTLSGRVRILAQQGRIAAPSPERRQLVHLLDRVVVAIARDERVGCFHPKTWVVRWRSEAADTPARWALVVSSRNLTSSQDWDLGVVLTGVEGGEGILLPTLQPYVRWLLSQTGEPSFGGDVWNRLSSVRWKGPCSELAFGFHGDRPIAWKDGALARLGNEVARRVLIVSPFLDVEALREAETRLTVAKPLEGSPRRLIAGHTDLEDLARQPAGRSLLASLGDVRSLAPSCEGVSVSDEASTTGRGVDEVHATEVGLHAKAIAVWHVKNDVSVLVGSANLSRRGWTGVNAEAWVRMRGRGIADALWAWSEKAVTFHYESVEAPSSEENSRRTLERSLDAYCAEVSLTQMALDDAADGALRAGAPLPRPPRGLEPLVSVGRLGASHALIVWPPGSSETRLGAVRDAERTQFVVVHVRAAGVVDAIERTWVQLVSVTPPIDGRRDGEAIAEALGPRGFMAYLNSLLDPTGDERHGDREDGLDAVGRSGRRGEWEMANELSLETLLRTFARYDSVRIEVVRAQISRAIEMYRGVAGARDDGALSQLWEAWEAIEQGFGRQGVAP